MRSVVPVERPRSGQAHYRPELIASAEEFLRLEGAWTELFARATDQHPFVTWAWQSTWLRHFGNQDSIRVFTVRVGDQLVAVAPMVIDRVGPGPLSVGVLRPFSHNIGDYCGALIHQDHPQAADLLASQIVEFASASGCSIELTRFRDGAGFAAVVQTMAGRFRWQTRALRNESVLVRRIDFGNEPGPLYGKSTVANRERKFERDLGGLFVYQDPGHVEEWLATAIALHDDRWSQRLDKYRGSLATAERQAFVREVLTLLGPDVVRFSFLRAHGTVVAGVIGFEIGNRYFYWRPAMSNAYKSYQVGHVLIANIMRTLSQRKVGDFDFMRGEDSYKTRWADQYASVTSITMSPGWRTHPLVAARIATIDFASELVRVAKRARRVTFRVVGRLSTLRRLGGPIDVHRT